MKRIARTAFLLLACGLTYGAQAQNCTNLATGNWGTAANWNCTLPAGARVPTNADNVIVINNTTVTVNIVGAVAGSVTINGGANATSLTMGGAGTTLTVTNAGGRSGNVVINAPTANVTKQLAVGARSLTVTGNVTINGGTAGGGAANISQLSVTTTPGTANIGGNLIINAGTVDTSVARATVTTGTINVTGNATLTGGGTNSRDALLSATGVSAVGAGVNIGGTLTINSTVAASSSVTLGTGSRITVTGAGGVTNGDTLSVGVGIFSMTNAGATLTTLNNTVAATTSVTTGSLTVAGSAVVNSGGNGLSTMSLTNGTISIGGNLSVTAAAATVDTGDATASVTGTGTMNVAGNVTVTGGSTALRDALLTVTGASGVGAGINIGGSLSIVSTIAASATVSTTNASSRITVTGAGGVTNGDTLSVGVGIFSMTNAGATLTTLNNTVAATTSVTTGTLTVAGNAIVNSGGNGLSTMSLTNGTISIVGNLSVTAAAATVDTGDATASVTGTGTMNVTGNVTVTGGVNANRDALLTVTGASGVGAGINIGGSLSVVSTIAASATVSTTNASSRITVTGAGGVTNGDTLSVGVGIFSMTNAGATLTTRNPLIVAGTTVTSGTLTIAGNAVVDPGGIGASTLTVSTGVISIGGNLGVTTATATNDNGDATANVTGTGRMDVTGNVTVTGGSNNARDALLTVTGASGVGQGINITGSLTVNATVAGSSTVSLTNASSRMTVGGAATNNDTVTVGVGMLTVTGDYTNNNQAFAVATTVSTGTLTVGGTLTNAATETITISSTGIVNANGGFTNSGTFANTTTGQLFLRGATSTINGTFTRGTGTVTLNGSVVQSLLGTALNPPTTLTDGFNNLVINNAAGVSLGSNVVARGVITFTSGEVSTGANVLIAEAGCATPSVVQTSGHVVGNFQKMIPAGGSTCNYEIGSAGAYTPVALTFSGVAVGGGRLIARTTAGDHPNIATSGFNVARTVNRWWALTTTGVTGTVLPAFTNYSATFTFINPGDLDGGIDPLLFETKHWNGAIWSVTATGTRTLTTTQATGITALGEFAIGEAGVPPPGSFNAFETGTGAGLITGVIRTRRAGIAFSLDVVAIAGGIQLAGFTDAVLVELLGNNTLGVALDGNNCPTTFTVVQTVTPDPTITGGRSTVNFTAVVNSWRDVRVRVRWPAAGPFTVTSCSTNNFAIRPDAFTGFAASNNTRTTPGTTNTLNSTAFGALVHNAGRAFSVRANAVNGAGSPAITTNYVGTPSATLTACGPGVGFEACTPSFGSLTLGTTFAAGALVADAAQYDDAGSFNLQLIDDDFASVDNADSTLMERRIASSIIAVGRFVPDNFAVAFNVPVFVPACTGFTYLGQTFNYATPPVITVTAREAGGNTTTRYAGDWWRLTPSTLTPATQAARYTAASGTLDLANLPAVAADPVVRYNGDGLPSEPAAGTGTLTFSGGSGFSFTRNSTTPATEFDVEIALGISVTDADSVAYAANPAAFGAASPGNGILFSDSDAGTINDKRMRYGRLRLGGVSGSQLLVLRIPVEAQHWNGTAFVTNTLDNCTTLAAGNIGLGNYVGSLNAGETTVTNVSSPLQAGRSAIELSAPGAGNFGSVDVALNLGSGAAADACAAFAPAATAGNLAHLRGRWCNPPGTYAKDPSVRARFGIQRGSDETIYIRENF